MAASQQLNASPLWCPYPCLLQLWLSALKTVQNAVFLEATCRNQSAALASRSVQTCSGARTASVFNGWIRVFSLLVCIFRNSYLPEFMKSPSAPLCTGSPCKGLHRSLPVEWQWLGSSPGSPCPTVLVEAHLPPGRDNFQEGSCWRVESGCMPMYLYRNVRSQHAVGIHWVPPTPVWCCTHINLSLCGSRCCQHLPWGTVHIVETDGPMFQQG